MVEVPFIWWSIMVGNLLQQLPSPPLLPLLPLAPLLNFAWIKAFVTALNWALAFKHAKLNKGSTLIFFFSKIIRLMEASQSNNTIHITKTLGSGSIWTLQWRRALVVALNWVLTTKALIHAKFIYFFNLLAQNTNYIVTSSLKSCTISLLWFYTSQNTGENKSPMRFA